MPSSRGEAAGAAADADVGWAGAPARSRASWRERLTLLVPPTVIAALIIAVGLGLGWHFANVLVLKDARFVGLSSFDNGKYQLPATRSCRSCATVASWASSTSAVT